MPPISPAKIDAFAPDCCHCGLEISTSHVLPMPNEAERPGAEPRPGDLTACPVCLEPMMFGDPISTLVEVPDSVFQSMDLTRLQDLIGAVQHRFASLRSTAIALRAVAVRHLPGPGEEYRRGDAIDWQKLFEEGRAAFGGEAPSSDMACEMLVVLAWHQFGLIELKLNRPKNFADIGLRMTRVGESWPTDAN